MKFYTWLDIEVYFKKKSNNNQLPSGVSSIKVYSDCIEIYANNKETENLTKKAFSEWFKDWYDIEKNCIYLMGEEKDKNCLPVIFNNDSDILNKLEPNNFRPFFSEATLFSDSIPSSQINFPHPLNDVKVFAFYSFKGGVGRTLHLIAAAKSIIENNSDSGKKILIIDADLEAPGLTWWAKNTRENTDFSFIDLISLAHYDFSNDYQHTLSIATKTIKEAPLSFGRNSCYFLPAFRNTDQLLRFPLRPENLVKSPNKSWIIGDLLFLLGKSLEVDNVLIDLRAGLSELSSPILFDPRVIKIIVTTYSRQSIEGTELAVKQMSKLAPPMELVDESIYYDPIVIFSMIPEELAASKYFSETTQELLEIYPDREREDVATPTRMTTTTTFFAHELLYLESLNSTLKKLEGTMLYKRVDELVNSLIIAPQKTEESHYNGRQEITNRLKNLERICEKLEFAESGSGKGFLPIKAIVELGQRFSKNMPLAVVVGSKGSGKTYLFMQLMYLQNWSEFLKTLSIHGINNIFDINTESQNIFLYPLLEPHRLKDEAAKITSRIRKNISSKLGNNGPQWSKFDLLDAIRSAIKADTGWTISEWRKYWISTIGKMLGLNEKSGEKWIEISEIQANLKSLNLKLVMVVDGLEELFQEIKNSSSQQMALQGLLEIPLVLREYRENRLGFICFVRRDIIRSAIKQNPGQFENLYSNFTLTWSVEDALRLVLWVCHQSGVTIKPVETLLQLDIDDLTESLFSFWGRKLGPDKSKEAYTANWVLAVLSDYNGQMQARDLVRFIKNATDKSKRSVNYYDRLLQPAGIRGAIEPCSIKKIEEYEQEFANLKSIFDKLRAYEQNIKKIPFTSEKLGLNNQELESLETAGVIQEMDGRYYMHEIFRHGLGFTLERGARPKVLAMKRKYLPSFS